jgi:hypothetical protein
MAIGRPSALDCDEGEGAASIAWSRLRDEGDPGGVHVRPVRYADALWLTGVGFDPEKIGRQYHWAETPLQLYIAPARALFGPRRSAVPVIEVDGRRAGYIGCNRCRGTSSTSCSRGHAADHSVERLGVAQ